MIGKRFIISGMQVEIVSDEGDRWQMRNLTTQDTILMDKTVLDSSIRLGKAEEVLGHDNNS